ncbi:MAG: glycosyltransferase family 4 protein [Polaromonas sp.]|nr:glycosyltransferase family 4 protein [Polaromonas sp.]
MKIGLDLHVVDGLFQGSRTHVIELFSRVAKICPEYEFVALLDGVETLKRDYPGFDLPNVSVEKLKHTGPIKRLLWELPRLQRSLKLDLLHLQYILPMPSLCPTMVTIHDVLFESHPEYFTKFFRLRSQVFMRIAAQQAQHVFTVSEFSKREICVRYGMKTEAVTVTPNSADFSKFYPGTDGHDFLLKRGLKSQGYLLTVGRLEPRKNQVTLLKAYVNLGPTAPPLVIVGQRDFGFEEMLATVADSDARTRIFILENVGDKELPALYRNCLAFAYPSLAEGFGMPPLEAMASGVPVIAADNTGLTEVVGAAGLLINSHDVSGLSSALSSVCSNPSLRESLIAKGLVQAKSFSWDSSALAVADQYRKFAATL